MSCCHLFVPPSFAVQHPSPHPRGTVPPAPLYVNSGSQKQDILKKQRAQGAERPSQSRTHFLLLGDKQDTLLVLLPCDTVLSLSLEIQSSDKAIPATVMVVLISSVNYQPPDRMLGQQGPLVPLLGSIWTSSTSCLRLPGDNHYELAACLLPHPIFLFIIQKHCFSLCLWFLQVIREQKT